MCFSTGKAARVHAERMRIIAMSSFVSLTIATLSQSARGNPLLGKRSIWGDGQAWRVELASRNESIVQNDGYEAQIIRTFSKHELTGFEACEGCPSLSLLSG